jgi:hypothetical protein
LVVSGVAYGNPPTVGGDPVIRSPCLGVCTHRDPIMCAWLKARTIPWWLLSCQSTALEQLLWEVFKLAEAQTPAVREAAFVEWWCHCRPHCSGHQMHFDSEDEGRGGWGVRYFCLLTQSVRHHCLDWDSPTRRLMCSRHGHEEASPRGGYEYRRCPPPHPLDRAVPHRRARRWTDAGHGPDPGVREARRARVAAVPSAQPPGGAVSVAPCNLLF